MMAITARSRSPLMSVSSLNPPPVFFLQLHFRCDRDGIEQYAHLLSLHDGRDAHGAAEFRPLDEQRRVILNDLLDDEPVEKPAQRGQVLLDGGRRQRLGFDISGDVQRPDGSQVQAVFLAPAEELRGSLHIGRARVFVTDSRREEFQEMLTGPVTSRRDDRGQRKFRRSNRWDDFDAQLAHNLQNDFVKPEPP